MKLITRINNFISRVGTDKVLHASVGGNISFAVIVFCLLTFNLSLTGFCLSLAIAGAVTLLIGIFKELLDSKFDYKDIFATMLGWLMASMITAIPYLILLCFRTYKPL